MPGNTRQERLDQNYTKLKQLERNQKRNFSQRSGKEKPDKRKQKSEAEVLRLLLTDNSYDQKSVEGDPDPGPVLLQPHLPDYKAAPKPKDFMIPEFGLSVNNHSEIKTLMKYFTLYRGMEVTAGFLIWCFVWIKLSILIF